LKPFFHIKNHFRSKLLLLFCCTLFFVVFAQNNRSNLERKRQIILERIKETKSRLNETAEIKRKSEQNQASIQNNIEQKELTLGVVNEQLGNSSESLIRSHEVIESLNDDVLQLRSDYGTTLRKAFRQRLSHSVLAFLLSSENFNQLSQRFFYIKQIDKYRKYQVAFIKATQLSLKEKINRLEVKIEQREQKLEVIQEQKELLGAKLNEEEEKLSYLKKSEHSLKRDLQSQERQAKRLDNAIENVIRTEILERQRIMQEAASAVASYRRKQENNTVTTVEKNSEFRSSRSKRKKAEQESISRTSEPELKETPEVRALSDNFRNNKGNLPWPVKKGSISKGFGRQEHPSLRGIFTISNGIDIKTDANSEVSAVANGKVVAVQFIIGSDYLVIVQHGSFYTVYSNLDRSYVHKGDVIGFRQSIGRTASDKVHFEVWSNSSRENPKNWLAKL
jgi:murein hydrolase activator